MTTACIAAWNLMGGEINWPALEYVGAIVGVDDPEMLIRGLVKIRDHFAGR